MSLLSLQRRMARAVMAPLTPSERMRRLAPDGRPMRRVAAEFIKPNDRLTSFERLEIYNRQYWFRLFSGFAEDFPGVRAVLGDRRFDSLSKAYLKACPSRSFTLRNLGSRLDSWLRAHPRWAGARQKLVVDMARLEWADIEAFDGKAEPLLKPEDLAGVDPGRLRLRLQPYIQLLDLRYPVDDLLLAVREDGPVDSQDASNAFNERRKHTRVAAVARLKPASIFLAVHRVEYSVYFRRLEPEEFAILRRLRQGKSLNQAMDGSFRGGKISLDRRTEKLAQWFHNWAALGWFCRPEKRIAKS
jgi:hypothetical protein